MRLILLGAPGAGKGTQGALLAETYGLDRVVTGDILRQAVREDTELGREARRYMDAGELVPDHLILEMLKAVLARAENGFVMDGFPRTLEQARSFDRTLKEMALDLDAVLVLDAPEDVVVKRISGRRSCPKCGAVYNVHFDTPSENGACDRCGGTLVQRVDDREDTVLNRLRVYREETRPLIEHYRTANVPVKRVDADRPVDEVQADLRDVLLVG
jgi:adenylate kinase